ncbi:heparinase II/III domain-containing protein [Aeromonas dhakensis]|uniref:heparinase II/III domain-containing protein n=1 Tax=Aeromonas dhakensis TaxID=196024 RepID=UPI001CF04F3A|nr:heparinase II/III family protein [Aeromonas dhakensis]UCM43849.1 heparinase II/III-family protein [Aeromonas dhakensis]
MIRKLNKILVILMEFLSYFLFREKNKLEFSVQNESLYSSYPTNETKIDWNFRVFSNDIMRFDESSFNLHSQDKINKLKNFHHFIKIRSDRTYDIKVPWEIGRLNFLTEQSIRNCAILSDMQKVSDISAFSNVGFGVQWKCAMDVALRAITIVLLNRYQKSGLGQFSPLLSDSLSYILLNLEKYGDWRGNHYLSNLAGLLICAAHDDSSRANKLFDFALIELNVELDRQFLSDGANFEGSTAYHFFGLELLSIIHTVLKNIDYEGRIEHYKNPYLITNLGLKKCQFSPSIFKKVISKLESKIANGLEFAVAVLDNNGRLIQIGDNDSGRVFRTCYLNDYAPDFYADILYQISESLKNEKFPCLVASRDFYLDYLNNFRNCSTASEFGIDQLLAFNKNFDTIDKNCKKTHVFRLGSDCSEFKIKYFDCFGLVVARSHDSILTFRCGPIGQFGKGGHDHYDQLSITLTTDGNRLISDPGVGCYTKDIYIRNKYRSSKSHFGVHGKKDFDDIGDLFRINSTSSKLIAIAHGEILGFQQIGDVEKYRKIELLKGKVIIKDVIVNDELSNSYEEIPYSPGYGIIEDE